VVLLLKEFWNVSVDLGKSALHFDGMEMTFLDFIGFFWIFRVLMN